MYCDQGATFSECGSYRYQLWRHWGPRGRVCTFIGLNPSTANEFEDDPTIRRCVAFARQWGWDGVEVVNLFAYRSTQPQGLRQVADPIGPENDVSILAAIDRTAIDLRGAVIAAWGVQGKYLQRNQAVCSLLRQHRVPLFCLGTTQHGHPRHPLYLAQATPLQLWQTG